MRRACLLLCCCAMLLSCRKNDTPREAAGGGVEVVTQPKVEPKVESGLPAPVQLLVTSYANECKQLGGRLTGGKDTPAIQTADLDGDGKPDYILDPKNLQCSASASVFCPNAGCEIRIATSESGYEDPLFVLGGTPVVKGDAVEIEVQHFNCKDADRDDTCISTVTWDRDKEKLIQSFAVRK